MPYHVLAYITHVCVNYNIWIGKKKNNVLFDDIYHIYAMREACTCILQIYYKRSVLKYALTDLAFVLKLENEDLAHCFNSLKHIWCDAYMRQ